MTIKYLYIVLFSLILQFGAAQQTFSEKDLHAFVNVYMSFKTLKKRNPTNDKFYFDKHKVSQKRYKEIANAALNNEDINLRPNEEQLRKDLKKQDELATKTNKELLEKICFANDLSMVIYSSILNKYKTDIHFQRSLKPHFEAYINRLK